MSAGMASCTNSTVVFVRLLGEGTDVWRPVTARELGGDRFLLLEPDDYDPEDEEWEFLPNRIVICQHESRDGRQVLIASKYSANPMTDRESQPTWGDTVRVRTTSFATDRVGEFASVCGITEVESVEQAQKFGCDPGTTVFLVEFVDGSSIEIPGCFLEIVDDP